MNSIELDGKTYEPSRVIECLKGQVLPSRFKRIEEVVQRRNKNLIPVMENIYNRDNTSAVMRSAEAFGFHLFHQILPNHDVFKESKQRVTSGADKWLVQSHWPETTACVKFIKSQGYKVLVTRLEGGRPLWEIPWDQPVALCFGNERQGVSPQLADLADESVYIPISGFVQSFNVSVAAALCFQHIQREMARTNLPGLSTDERQYLMALYLFRSCKKPILPPL